MCPKCNKNSLVQVIDDFEFQGLSLQSDGSVEPHGKIKRLHYECTCGYDSRKV